MSKQTCNTCKFFQYDEHLSCQAQGNFCDCGYCKRNPPKFVGFDCTVEPMSYLTIVAWSQPLVAAHDYCGDYQKTPTKKPAKNTRKGNRK